MILCDNNHTSILLSTNAVVLYKIHNFRTTRFLTSKDELIIDAKPSS